MFAVSLALIAQEFGPGRERANAMGIYGGTIGVAVAVGPLVGGALTDSLGWESIFLLNLPIGIAALALTFLRVAREPRPARHARRRRRRDDLQRRALPARARARARERRGLGQPAHPRPARRRRRAARRVRRGRDAQPRADAAARAVPAAGLHGRPARGVRDLGLGLRAVPLPDAVHAEHPRPDAVRGRPALPAADPGGVRRLARRRDAAPARAGAPPAGRRPGRRRHRGAADGRGRTRATTGRRCSPASSSRASASASSTR